MFKPLLRLLTLLLSVFTFSYTQTVSSFQVFDSTLYKSHSKIRDKGIPKAFTYGIKTLETMYGGNIWPEHKHKHKMENPPDAALLKESVKRVRKSIGAFGINVICLDIEHWSLNEKKPLLLNKNINKYIATIESFKKEMPDMQFGFYSMLPVRNYYDALEPETSDKYIEWQKQNDKLISIAQSADIIFPSLYTFSSNREDWVRYAVENIKQAKRYGKPVYVYLWPQYHSSVRFIGLDFMPADFWQLQLETALKYADGVVIWGGWNFDTNKQLEWDANAGWWLVLEQFMKKLPK